jgi:hypothetical protein
LRRAQAQQRQAWNQTAGRVNQWLPYLRPNQAGVGGDGVSETGPGGFAAGVQSRPTGGFGGDEGWGPRSHIGYGGQPSLAEQRQMHLAQAAQQPAPAPAPLPAPALIPQAGKGITYAQPQQPAAGVGTQTQGPNQWMNYLHATGASKYTAPPAGWQAQQPAANNKVNTR